MKKTWADAQSIELNCECSSWGVHLNTTLIISGVHMRFFTGTNYWPFTFYSKVCTVADLTVEIHSLGCEHTNDRNWYRQIINQCFHVTAVIIIIYGNQTLKKLSN